MDDSDHNFMREAINWAKGCAPEKESIPKVGAVLVVAGKTIARGRRGTGILGDDDHAEYNAIDRLKDKSQLAEATLYTTLEPCTPEVRSDPHKCCTKLIIQHEIKRVFVGILDPNQGVTGKGVSALQKAKIDVELFPPKLSHEIRAINAAFIRMQETVGAQIISPKNGETLKTYESGGKLKIRFACANPPQSNNYLLSFLNGQCWPQAGNFQHINGNEWEATASFGSAGEHTLHLVTATDLGKAIIDYYWKVVGLNIERRKRFKISDTITVPEVELNQLLGGDYPGIAMTGLPKGIRSEASVNVMIAEKPK
jgi:pyrimidine deaminase RibD-like protein